MTRYGSSAPACRSSSTATARLVFRLTLLAAVVAAAFAANPAAAASSSRRSDGTVAVQVAQQRNAPNGVTRMQDGLIIATRPRGGDAPTAAAAATAVVADTGEGEDEDDLAVEGRAWTPFYWGPQGFLIGPSWFGLGLGGGNWRPIPNQTPFGPPGVKANKRTKGIDTSGSVGRLTQAQHAAIDASPDYQSVLIAENFSCHVYTCRLGVVETNTSTLQVYHDSEGVKWARLKCFLFLDDFEAYGCREWDRLELTIAQTDEAYDCGMPFDIPATSVWTNAVKKRRSKLECEGRVPAYQGSGR
uniref:Uncharacterized protein n=1 Tax=Mantoniella antarctica TaxID=81844 RepID=A0A7S0SDE4_9CHLO|mmetsp:Transcript_17002/g.41982  ORF Transcript_17002/g.41982 Transcript_17002/m.41982 type:complete len:301 (+) Transcript_17002:340-1242(+)